MNLIQNGAYYESSDMKEFRDFCVKVDSQTCAAKVSMFDLSILWLQASRWTRAAGQKELRFIPAYSGCLNIPEEFVDPIRNKISFDTEDIVFNVGDPEISNIVEDLEETKMIFRFDKDDYFIDDSALKTLGSAFHIPPQLFEERSLASAIAATEVLGKTERLYNILYRTEFGMSKIVAFIGRRYKRNNLVDIMDSANASGLTFLKGTWDDTECHIYLTDKNSRLTNGQVPIVDILTSDTCHYADGINFGWGSKDSPEDYFITSTMAFPEDDLEDILKSLDIRAEADKYLQILEAVDASDIKTVIRAIGKDISVSDKRAIISKSKKGLKPSEAILSQLKEVNSGYAKNEFRKSFKNLGEFAV